MEAGGSVERGEPAGLVGQLARIFFQSDNITVNLLPAIAIIGLLIIVLTFSGLDGILGVYYRFYGRFLSKFSSLASAGYSRLGGDTYDTYGGQDWDGEYEDYEDVGSLVRDYQEDFRPAGLRKRRFRQAAVLAQRMAQLSEKDLALLN